MIHRLRAIMSTSILRDERFAALLPRPSALASLGDLKVATDFAS
jgi:hypothetical protein